MDALLELIPNDDSFEPYGEFIEMGAAMFGASAGAEWGRVRWLHTWRDLCSDQASRTASPRSLGIRCTCRSRAGAQLRMFANERAPYEMALRAFAEPEIEPEVIEQAGEEMDARRAFLEGWALVGGRSVLRTTAQATDDARCAQPPDDPRDERRPPAGFGRQQGRNRRRPLRPAQSQPGQRHRPRARPGRFIVVDADKRF